MHDHAQRLESGGGKPCSPFGHRQAECPDASDTLVEGGPQYGAGMADSIEPPSGNGEQQIGAPVDMASIRSTRGRDRSDESQSRPEERLASLGNPAGKRRQPLHPQTQPSAMTPEKPTGPVSTENVLRLLEYQVCRCALTGRPLTPDLASLDHVIPIGVGGEHCIDNTQILHRDVNRAKGSLTNEEFLQLCSEVITHAAALGSRTIFTQPPGEIHV